MTLSVTSADLGFFALPNGEIHYEIGDQEPHEENSIVDSLKNVCEVAIKAIFSPREFYTEYRLSRQSKAKFSDAFSKLPENSRWRCFIDWSFQNKGKDAFEDEKGYRRGMEKGLTHVSGKLFKRFDHKDLVELHSQCVDKVQHTKGWGKQVFFKKGISGVERSMYQFPRIATTKEKEIQVASKAAIKEWGEKKVYEGYPNYTPSREYFTIFNGHFADSIMRSFGYGSWSNQTDNIKERIDREFSHYYEEIKTAHTAKEKIRAIVNLCVRLEVTHPFTDGNQRVIAFALLPKLLIENDLKPVILEYPALFDGAHTEEELIKEVEQGAERFKRVCDALSQSPNGFISKEEIDKGNTLERNLT